MIYLYIYLYLSTYLSIYLLYYLLNGWHLITLTLTQLVNNLLYSTITKMDKEVEIIQDFKISHPATSGILDWYMRVGSRVAEQLKT